MKELATALGFIILAVVGGFALIVIPVIANEYWNCSSYKDAPVKMIAGTCYAQQKDGKWVSFTSYVKATNVNLN